MVTIKLCLCRAELVARAWCIPADRRRGSAALPESQCDVLSCYRSGTRFSFGLLRF